MLKSLYQVSPRLPQSESRDVELLDVGLWWWSALNLRLKNPFKVFSTSNWNLGGSSDGRQPPCLKIAAATFHFWKFWHFSHWIFGLILMLSKTLSENGCNNISDIFHIGTLCIAVNALAWFWCSQKLCKSLWSKLIGFCKMGIFQYFPTTRLWLMISDQLHCFRSIKSAQHGDKKSQHCREKLAENLFAVNYLQTACTLFFELSFFKSQVINARDCSTCYPPDKALPTIGPLGTWRLRGNGRTCCCSL